MQKNLKILLIASLLSIFLLIFISSNLEPKRTLIKEISDSNINQNLELVGNITILRNDLKAGYKLLRITDKTGNITAILFSKTNIKLNSSLNYRIIGKLQENNQNLQLNINKIVELE